MPQIKFSNSYIFATRWRKPLIFQTYIIWANQIHSLKYLRSTTLGFKDKEIIKSQFVTKTQFLWISMFLLFNSIVDLSTKFCIEILYFCFFCFKKLGEYFHFILNKRFSIFKSYYLLSANVLKGLWILFISYDCPIIWVLILSANKNLLTLYHLIYKCFMLFCMIVVYLIDIFSWKMHELTRHCK